YQDNPDPEESDNGATKNTGDPESKTPGNVPPPSDSEKKAAPPKEANLQPGTVPDDTPPAPASQTPANPPVKDTPPSTASNPAPKPVLDQDKALTAVQNGTIMPLKDALKQVMDTYPGKVIDIQMTQTMVGSLYDVKIRTPEGEIKSVTVDAKTGQIVQKIGF
ncbi:MAG: hypothetical protein RIR97_467, partial [Pseudomonadota bacterium]